MDEVPDSTTEGGGSASAPAKDERRRESKSAEAESTKPSESSSQANGACSSEVVDNSSGKEGDAVAQDEASDVTSTVSSRGPPGAGDVAAAPLSPPRCSELSPPPARSPRMDETTPTPSSEPAAPSEPMEEASSSQSPRPPPDEVEFKVIFNKQKLDLTFDRHAKVLDLKNHLTQVINIPAEMQKVMIRGRAENDKTLAECGLVKGGKVMVVGSKVADVLNMTVPPAASDGASASTETVKKEPLSEQKLHKKIVDKGPPDDALPGIKDCKDHLPPFPLSGMVNKSGGKVRLTFKFEADQLWIGTKELTNRIPMNSIRSVISEPIKGKEEYHIMGLQLGPTEASRYWLYWVPAQYVDAIKDAILGKWQTF